MRIRPASVFFAVALIVTLIPVQYSIINRLPFPGAGPDLLVVVVVAVGLARGPEVGIVFGFAMGFAADLAPPADHAAGRLALAYALAGYVGGLFAADAARSAFIPVAVVGLGALVAQGTFALVGALLGDARITTTALIHNVPSSVLYDVVLAPFVVPLVGSVSRRLAVDPSRR